MDEQDIEINGIPLPNKITRRNIIAVTLIFCWSIIIWLIADGKSDNSLHTSDLAWSFGVSTAVIMAYVFGAVVDNFNVLKNSGGNFNIKKK